MGVPPPGGVKLPINLVMSKGAEAGGGGAAARGAIGGAGGVTDFVVLITPVHSATLNWLSTLCRR